MSEVTRYKWSDPIGDFEGRPIYGGDCWNGMPALYMTGLEETGRRYAETEEEWELFGAHLPHEVTVIKDIVIGCVNYQALVAAGMAIQDCGARCPLRQVELSEQIT